MRAGLSKLAERYVRFAAIEARGSSPTYEQLALAVSRSPELLEFLAGLPEDRQQPNLFFAAVRKTAGVPRGGDHLVEIVREQAPHVRQIMLARTTQTNEPARCAVLLPALARLPQPLALLEVGASAGLCLLPDLYGYDYGRARLMPRSHRDRPSVVFPCKVNGAAPLPLELPAIAWHRAWTCVPSTCTRATIWAGWKCSAGTCRTGTATARGDRDRARQPAADRQGQSVGRPCGGRCVGAEERNPCRISHRGLGLRAAPIGSRPFRRGGPRIGRGVDQQRGAERVFGNCGASSARARRRSFPAVSGWKTGGVDRSARSVDSLVRGLTESRILCLAGKAKSAARPPIIACLSMPFRTDAPRPRSGPPRTR